MTYISGQPPVFYRIQRMELKAQGICTRCRKVKAESNRTKCFKCLEDTRIHNQKRGAGQAANTKMGIRDSAQTSYSSDLEEHSRTPYNPDGTNTDTPVASGKQQSFDFD